MSKAYHDYVNFGYFLLVLLIMSAVAFTPAYFRLLSSDLPGVMHVHAILMYGWLMIIIAQPLLIKSKNFTVHRWLGRLTLLWMPLLVVSSYLMFQYAYERDLDVLTKKALESGGLTSVEDAVRQARIYTALGFYYFFGLIIFYPLGIANRRNRTIHAKYMIAASLMVTGPIVDRTLFFLADSLKINAGFPLEYVSFVLIDCVLVWLLYDDLKRNESMRTTLICFGILFSGQLLYHTGRTSEAWQVIVGWLL